MFCMDVTIIYGYISPVGIRGGTVKLRHVDLEATGWSGSVRAIL